MIETKNTARKGLKSTSIECMKGFGGLRETTSDGRKAANIANLSEGDNVVFYLMGKERRLFLGTCQLASARANEIRLFWMTSNA
jgi:hypothetical protein